MKKPASLLFGFLFLLVSITGFSSLAAAGPQGREDKQEGGHGRDTTTVDSSEKEQSTPKGRSGKTIYTEPKVRDGSGPTVRFGGSFTTRGSAQGGM